MGAQLYSSAEEARAELRRQGIAMEEAKPAEGVIDWGARLGELLESWQKVMTHGRQSTTSPVGHCTNFRVSRVIILLREESRSRSRRKVE